MVMDIKVWEEKYNDDTKCSVHLTRVSQLTKDNKNVFGGVIKLKSRSGYDEIEFSFNTKDFGWLLQNMEMMTELYLAFSTYEQTIDINNIRFCFNNGGVCNAFSR